jgi:hypothetical protein
MEGLKNVVRAAGFEPALPTSKDGGWNQTLVNPDVV